MTAAAGLRPLVFASCLLLASCSRPTYVAEVNNEKITTEEFKVRYGAYIKSQASTRDNILLRQKILDNMINELLIFEDAHRQGFDGDSQFQERMEDIREQALLDKYARSISIDTVNVSEEELWKEFHAFNSKVKARYLYARTASDAAGLKSKLNKGSTFEELARDVFSDPGLANNGGDLGYFGWGEMEPALEEVAFSLPVGATSDPIRLKVGFAIVQVENRVEIPLASQLDFEKNRERLASAIIDRKVMRLIADAARAVERDLNPTFNEASLAAISKNWQYVFNDGAPLVKEPPPEIENSSSRPFVIFQGITWTVGDFRQKLQRTTEKQRRRIKSVADIKDAAIGLAVREVLLSKARLKGLGSSHDVLDQVEKARQLYLLKRWAASVQDTVGSRGWDERLVRDEYDKKKADYVDPPQVNVAEILVRTEHEADSLARIVRRGADFAAIARKSSIRIWAAKKGGELGYAPMTNYGALGEKFFASRVGEIIGPEKVEPYFGIFKILGRHDGRQKSFEDSRSQIENQLGIAKKQEVFKGDVESLRSRARVSINQNNLANVDLN